MQRMGPAKGILLSAAFAAAVLLSPGRTASAEILNYTFSLTELELGR